MTRQELQRAERKLAEQEAKLRLNEARLGLATEVLRFMFWVVILIGVIYIGCSVASLRSHAETDEPSYSPSSGSMWIQR